MNAITDTIKTSFMSQAKVMLKHVKPPVPRKDILSSGFVYFVYFLSFERKLKWAFFGGTDENNFTERILTPGVYYINSYDK